MINLLPDEEKRSIRAARTNVILLRYNILTAGAIAVLVAFCAVFYIILYNNQQKALATSNSNEAKTVTLSKVRSDSDTYRSALTTAKAVLNNGISYTDVIIAITKLLPTGSYLDNIALTSASFNQPTTFEAHARSYDVAEQLKQKFETSSIFSNVYFQALTDTSTSGNYIKGYPITISFSATLQKAEAFDEN